MSDPKKPTLWEVPPDTPAATCSGPNCRKEVYWVRTKAGRNMPVDCAAGAGCQPPSVQRPGYVVAHWVTCQDREYFNRQRAKRAANP